MPPGTDVGAPPALPGQQHSRSAAASPQLPLPSPGRWDAGDAVTTHLGFLLSGWGRCPGAKAGAVPGWSLPSLLMAWLIYRSHLWSPAVAGFTNEEAALVWCPAGAPCSLACVLPAQEQPQTLLSPGGRAPTSPRAGQLLCSRAQRPLSGHGVWGSPSPTPVPSPRTHWGQAPSGTCPQEKHLALHEPQGGPAPAGAFIQ